MTATLDPSTKAHARALERLGSEKIGWLTSVDPNGQPQSSAIWFLWTDGEILLYSHKRAPRNGNLVDSPRVAFNLHTDAAGDDYVSMEGTARMDPDGPQASGNAPYLARYQSMIDDHGWTAASFAADYPFIIRITPTRWRVR